MPLSNIVEKYKPYLETLGDLIQLLRVICLLAIVISRVCSVGEFALSETLRDIIAEEQDHEIDLKDALGLR